jgi:hypothetical protein
MWGHWPKLCKFDTADDLRRGRSSAQGGQVGKRTLGSASSVIWLTRMGHQFSGDAGGGGWNPGGISS